MRHMNFCSSSIQNPFLVNGIVQIDLPGSYIYSFIRSNVKKIDVYTERPFDENGVFGDGDDTRTDIFAESIRGVDPSKFIKPELRSTIWRRSRMTGLLPPSRYYQLYPRLVGQLPSRPSTNADLPAFRIDNEISLRAE